MRQVLLATSRVRTGHQRGHGSLPLGTAVSGVAARHSPLWNRHDFTPRSSERFRPEISLPVGQFVNIVRFAAATLKAVQRRPSRVET
jgi:hypothetical protein